MVGNTAFDGHEAVVPISDEATGLAGFIAIHSTKLGPAAGGCRFARYPNADAALGDALRLSRGMSFKNALAGLPSGGGKAVLYKIGAGVPRAAAFEAFGRAVGKLRGRYVTAEDVGTTVADMEAIASQTRYVAGLPRRAGRAGGDPSPWTALGVFLSLEAALQRPLRGSRVAVQGLGSVGFKVCEHLHAGGARLVVADVDEARAEAARHAFGAEVESVERIHRASADLFSPNALGAVLNTSTIGELGSPVVCGGANNQLATEADGQRLFDRGVLYAPDYVVNAGGIINVMAEYFDEPASSVEARVRQVGERTRELLEQARREKCSPDRIADRQARAKLGLPEREMAS